MGEVQFDELALDVMQRLGQTRKVDDHHVQALVEEFGLNPPHTLEMTVWMDQSVPPVSPSLPWHPAFGL